MFEKPSSMFFRYASLTIITCVACLFFNLPVTAQNDIYVVRTNVSSCLNVRTEPNTDAESVACLDPGVEVIVLNTVPFWREVSFGANKKGWVAKKFIEPKIAIDTSHPDSIVIPEDAVLTVHFIDVGQGDAIWIQTHDDNIDGNGMYEGYSIMIDGGPYSANTNNPLGNYIENKAHHNAEIEALILTHPHDDHYNGAEWLSRHFEINHYYDPGYPRVKPEYVAIIDAMKGTNGQTPRAKNIHIGKSNFDEMNWGAELKVEVLYAWNGDPDNVLGSGNTEENNASIVLKLQYGEHSFLFMGDAEGKDRDDNPTTPRYVEKILLDNQPEKLKATVLKIAHHGSETSSTIPFIQAVDPDIVVVQSGRKSFHGTYLPDISTLKRYCDHNSEVMILRTDQGDETVTSVRQAVDNDHIVVRTNGKGTPAVEALNGGHPYHGNFCEEVISRKPAKKGKTALIKP